MCIEREYWEQKSTIDRLEEENSQLKDEIKATNQIIKEFLDLFNEGKIEINFPEFGMGVSTECGSYNSNAELLKEIVDIYDYRVKHKEMYDSERSKS